MDLGTNPPALPSGGSWGTQNEGPSDGPSFAWYDWWDSDPRPEGYEPSALSAELQPHPSIVAPGGCPYKCRVSKAAIRTYVRADAGTLLTAQPCQGALTLGGSFVNEGIVAG